MNTDNSNNSDKLEVFDEDFEVIYEGDLPEPQKDTLGSDAYKDVLASLAELDGPEDSVLFLLYFAYSDNHHRNCGKISYVKCKEFLHP